MKREPAPTARLTPATRHAIALSLAVGFLLPSAALVATGLEAWPLSSYPMYAAVESERPIVDLEVVLVSEDGREQSLGGELIHPFGRVGLRVALKRLLARDADRASDPDASPGATSVERALIDLAHRAARRAREEGRTLPPAAAVRLYALTWPPRASGADAPSRKLLTEAPLEP